MGAPQYPPPFSGLQELVASGLPSLMDEDGWGLNLFLFSLLLSRGVQNIQVREHASGCGVMVKACKSARDAL
jgi:hypothetical protein